MIVRGYFLFIICCQFITGNWDDYGNKQHFWRNSLDLFWANSNLKGLKSFHVSVRSSSVSGSRERGAVSVCKAAASRNDWSLWCQCQSTCLQKGSFWFRAGKHGLFWSPSFQDHVCSLFVCFSPSVITPFSLFPSWSGVIMSLWQPKDVNLKWCNVFLAREGLAAWHQRRDSLIYFRP